MPARSTSPRLLLLAAAWLLALPARATVSTHQLAVTPPEPTTVDPITVRITGEWPASGTPTVTGWSRTGSVLRIDATGVLPGIPQPFEPYERTVDVGRLPAGAYRIEYYLTTLAAPRGPSPQLVATLDFQVIEAIPTLAGGALALLAASLAAAAAYKLRR